MTRWQRFLWRLGFTGYAHVDNALGLLEQRDLEMARSLLRSAGKQRDHAHLLLRAVREVCSMPEALERSINCATADESESDIDRHEAETAAFLARKGIDWWPPYTEQETTK